jgi:maltose alpha-D-glucosyltransferase/alpha-amylase
MTKSKIIKPLIVASFVCLIITSCINKSSENKNNIVSSEITGQCTAPPDFPKWVDHAVFYQIYPQSFYDSNGDGIGDLKGITEKLDYIKSLGVDAIWINPFFESPFCDGGYDISDYYKVAPRYGTNEDAKKLFEEAHKRGLRILFDFVASYTSIDNPWFKASAEQKKNKYSNWYIWTDNTWMNPPDEFKNLFVKGFGTRNGQYMLNFYYCEPALNYGFANPDSSQKWELPINNPDVLAMRAEMENVVKFWMDLGADGFRADMAGALVKSTNSKGDEQFFNTREEGTKQFWREIRSMFKKDYPEAFMISEWSYPSSAISGGFHADFFHWFDGFNDLFQKESWRILNGYSSGHSYFDKEGKGNITYFLKNYLQQYNQVKGKGYISLPLGNHDNARLANHRSDDDLEIIYAFGLTMPGVTFLYYGNEIGMRQLGANWPQVEGAYRPRNGARTPMQWSKGKNLGFSTANADKLYLPVDTAADAPTVDVQEKDTNSLLNRTRRLIALKHSEPALAAYAEFSVLYAKENSYPFIYARSLGKDVVIVILNPAGQENSADFDINIPFKDMKLLAGSKIDYSHNGNNMSIKILGRKYAIYRLIE